MGPVERPHCVTVKNSGIIHTVCNILGTAEEDLPLLAVCLVKSVNDKENTAASILFLNEELSKQYVSCSFERIYVLQGLASAGDIFRIDRVVLTDLVRHVT